MQKHYQLVLFFILSNAISPLFPARLRSIPEKAETCYLCTTNLYEVLEDKRLAKVIHQPTHLNKEIHKAHARCLDLLLRRGKTTCKCGALLVSPAPSPQSVAAKVASPIRARDEIPADSSYTEIALYCALLGCIDIEDY